MTQAGYLSESYARSFNTVGDPIELKGCQGWIIRRPIPRSEHFDAMGCYPLFCCNNWHRLSEDLEQIGSSIVTLTVVTDPFGDYDIKMLMGAFPDLVLEYKQHFVTELRQDKAKFVSSHNARYGRKSSKIITIDIPTEPQSYLKEWVDLYSNLIARHQIHGLAVFSIDAFQEQLSTAGCVMFRAIHMGETVGATIWYVQGDIAYYHLGAYSEMGYIHRASYAIMWTAIDYFREKGLNWLNFGAGAGITNRNDGLNRFKEGWSTGMRQVYLCGRIFQGERYKALSPQQDVKYFPAYRFGEFN